MGGSRIFVGTLGTCVLRVDGRVVSGVPTIFHKIASYLLISGENGSISRQRLRDVLWSQTDDPERASANLRRSLARIRALQKSADFSLIGSNFSSVYLIDDPQVTWDLRDLLVALADKQSEIGPGVYPGDLLSNIKDGGPEFEDWLSEQRSRLHNRFAERLTDGMTDAKWAQKSSSERKMFAQYLLAVDPCNEQAYRLLMLEAAANHNIARLREIFVQCEAEFRRELGLPVSSETRDLYRGLMRGLTGG